MAVHFSHWLLLLVSTAFMASFMLASASDCKDECKKVKSCCKSYMCAPSCHGCQDACKRCAKVYRVCVKRVCGERSCGNPGSVIGASHSGTYKYGKKVTYTCNTGYERTAGDNTLTCGNDKKWIGTKPTCSKVNCGNPGNATGTTQSGTTYTYGANVTYTCSISYEMSTLTCGSNKQWIGTKPKCSSTRIGGRDCAHIYKKGTMQSGIYQIKPFSSGAKSNQEVSVYCDMQTDGGSWTVFQRRFDGSVDFFRNWDNYTNGFGEADGEYWLGLDAIHALTADPTELRVDVWDYGGRTMYEKYGVFSVGDSGTKYKLKVDRPSGTAGSALNHHNGMAFSTKDRDNDIWDRHCARDLSHGGWWYGRCQHSNLNAIYHNFGRYTEDAINWDNSKGILNLKRTKMMVRPSSSTSG